MYTVRALESETEFLQLYTAWHEAYDAPAPTRPKVALVVIENSTGAPVAMCGIVNTDSDYGIIDGLIKDPQASDPQIIKLLFISVGNLVIALGYKRALIHASLDVVKARAILVGAHRLARTDVYGIEAEDFLNYGIKPKRRNHAKLPNSDS